MLEQQKISVRDRSLLDLRNMLHEETLTLAEECFSILDECLDFIVWGVLNERVIILTGSARILFTVKKDDPDMVRVEYFPDQFHWEESSSHRKIFGIHKRHLKEVKTKLLDNIVRRVDFSELLYGQYYDTE